MIIMFYYAKYKIKIADNKIEDSAISKKKKYTGF